MNILNFKLRLNFYLLFPILICNFCKLSSQTLLTNLSTDEFFSVGYGFDVDIDEEFAVIGSAVGHVHIYRKDEMEWLLDQTLFDQDYGSGDFGFGTTVSISNDYLAIGNWNKKIVYLYFRESENWILVDSLSNVDAEQFGPFLSLDYPYLLVGGLNQVSEEKIYIYKREANQWILNDTPITIWGAGYVNNSTLDISNPFAVVGGTDSVQVYINNNSNWTLHQTIHKDYESPVNKGFGWSIDLFFDPNTTEYYLIIGDPYADSLNGRIQIYKTIGIYFEKLADFACSELGVSGAVGCGWTVSIDSDFTISSGTLNGDNGFLIFKKEVSTWSFLQGYTETQYNPLSFGYKVKLNGNNLLVSDFTPSGAPCSVFAYDMAGITNTSHLNNSTPSILIYPNPTSGKISIETNNESLISKINIRNTYGQLAYSFNFQKPRNQFEIKIDGNSGLYLLELITNSGEFVIKKIIKE